MSNFQPSTPFGGGVGETASSPSSPQIQPQNSILEQSLPLARQTQIPHQPRTLDSIFRDYNPDLTDAEVYERSLLEFEAREFRRGEAHDRLLARIVHYGLRERDVQGDGNCQFRAIADQLYGNEKHHGAIRNKVLERLQTDADFYRDYVGTSSSSTSKDVSPDESFNLYLVKMAEDGSWGDHVTLQAAADAFGCEIKLITSYETDAIISVKPRPNDAGSRSRSRSSRILWLTFWAEVHYNSVEEDPELH
ncbi:unnamed protein product [Amoebophrya sp. A25]|nr:unnamed protein product [Amoebophrya sp. A25]|eukprot:GSA25T00017152001.1